jgi:hypothetical protein
MSVQSPLARISAGRVVIGLSSNPAAVRVELEMPDAASKILPGKAAAGAHRLVPLLYGICANAHGQAAAAALAGAGCRDVSAPLEAARDALTAMEALREGLLKITTSWPDLAGEPADFTCGRAAMPLVGRMKKALFGDGDLFDAGASPNVDVPHATALITQAEQLLETFVFGEPAADWLRRESLAAVEAWATSGRTVAARLIGRITHQDSMQATDIARSPLGAAQIEALARSLEDGCPAGDAIAALDPCLPDTRLADRYSCPGERPTNPAMLDTLYALAHLTQTIRKAIEAAQAQPQQNTSETVHCGIFGIGTAWSPRGLLLHAATVTAGRIDRYDVIQPTRINFARKGAAERALRQLAETAEDDSNALAFKAQLIIAGFDPCVAHELRLN